jgi:hypothetical protein
MVVEARWSGTAQHSTRCTPKTIRRNDRGELHVKSVCKSEEGNLGEWPLDARWKLLDGGRRLRVRWGRK